MTFILIKSKPALIFIGVITLLVRAAYVAK